MTELRECLPPVPDRMQRRPIDRGYPVPWFVAWVDGKPDFRVVEAGKILRAIKEKLCWLCGEEMAEPGAFVIGPMCAVNRVTSEPPSHRDCAIFAATACPFLTKPHADRRPENMPAGAQEPAGVGLKRNPGASVVWITKEWHWSRVDNGVLCDIGDPIETLWYREGRAATREEINASIESGLPLLLANPPSDPAELAHGLTWIAGQLEKVWKLMPGEPDTRSASAVVLEALRKSIADQIEALVTLDREMKKAFLAEPGGEAS